MSSQVIVRLESDPQRSVSGLSESVSEDYLFSLNIQGSCCVWICGAVFGQSNWWFLDPVAVQSCPGNGANKWRFNDVGRNTAGFRPLQPARREIACLSARSARRRDRPAKSFDYKGHSRVKSVAETAFCWDRELFRWVQSRDSTFCFGSGSKKYNRDIKCPADSGTHHFPWKFTVHILWKTVDTKSKKLTFLKNEFEHIWHDFTCENNKKSCNICSGTFLLKV